MCIWLLYPSGDEGPVSVTNGGRGGGLLPLASLADWMKAVRANSTELEGKADGKANCGPMNAANGHKPSACTTRKHDGDRKDVVRGAASGGAVPTLKNSTALFLALHPRETRARAVRPGLVCGS